MKILPIKQRTPEWYALRKTKLGASDIATLMEGCTSELYQEKNGKEKRQTYAMHRGTIMEPEALAWFNNKENLIYEELVALHDTEDWLMASFDGYNFDYDWSVEIKCPLEVPDILERWESFKRYWWQVQAQLAVGGHEKAVLLAYSPLKQVQTTIHRDEDAIGQILAKGRAFFEEHMVKGIAPPETVLLREDPKVRELYESGYNLKQKLDEAEEEWKIWRESVEYVAGEQPFFYKGLRVERIAQKPKVDYKEIVEKFLPEIDTTSYQKLREPFWRITLTLKKEDQLQE